MADVAIAPIKLVARVPDRPGEYVGDRRISFEEYLELDHERGLAEWIDGEVHFYVGATAAHQRIVQFLSFLLAGFLESTTGGQVFPGGLVVRAAPLGNAREPDIVVVTAANRSRVKPSFVDGPPDLVVEVVSNDSVERDYETKRTEYAAAGVPEYWIVDARSSTVSSLFLSLRGGLYEAIPVDSGIVRSTVLPGFWLKPEWLSEEHPAPLARLNDVLAED